MRSLGALACVALALACSSKPPDEKSYVADIAGARAQKDEDFRRTTEVVPENRRAEFLPLAYFPIDPDYSVPASLKVTKDQTVLRIPTSTGSQRDMRRVGTLEFTLKGQRMQLTAFVEAGAPNVDRLFVPFTDMTSGTETYPAGRYLDLDRSATGVYIVDFNRAYHPYCYYNPTYDCPYPPAENRLKVPVRAGERLKHPAT